MIQKARLEVAMKDLNTAKVQLDEKRTADCSGTA